MHNPPYFDYIESNSIDLADRTYHFSPLRETVPDEALIASISQFGLLHPPVVRKKNNKVIIVTGRKRILAARLAGKESILCLLIPEKTEEHFILLLLAEETAFGPPLSLIEQAGLLDRFLQTRPTDEALLLLQRLGHKPQKYVLDELLSLLSLSQKAVAAVHLGKVAYRNALKMLRLAPENQDVMVHLISSLHLGGSKQSKLIEYCTELIMRTDKPLSRMLDSFLADDTAGTDDNIPQKTGALLTWLHTQCFPRMVKAEEEFKKSAASLNLPNHVYLEHSPSFEEETVKVSVHVSDMDTARQVVQEFLKITKYNANQ